MSDDKTQPTPTSNPTSTPNEPIISPLDHIFEGYTGPKPECITENEDRPKK
jgi:hypothetical protein